MAGSAVALMVVAAAKAEEKAVVEGAVATAGAILSIVDNRRSWQSIAMEVFVGVVEMAAEATAVVAVVEVVAGSTRGSQCTHRIGTSRSKYDR
eukprot:7382326-Prymnesium_polylepis.1